MARMIPAAIRFLGLPPVLLSGGMIPRTTRMPSGMRTEDQVVEIPEQGHRIGKKINRTESVADPARHEHPPAPGDARIPAGEMDGKWFRCERWCCPVVVPLLRRSHATSARSSAFLRGEQVRTMSETRGRVQRVVPVPTPGRPRIRRDAAFAGL